MRAESDGLDGLEKPGAIHLNLLLEIQSLPQLRWSVSLMVWTLDVHSLT